jgi:hypothetical protein
MDKNFSLIISEDHFVRVFTENPVTKNLFISFAVLTSVLGSLGLYSIIWFERFEFDHKRTILSMLSTLTCWSVMEFLLFVESIEILRFIVGPLPGHLCFAQQVFRSRILNDIILQYDANIICRYLCIFVLKNPAGLSDEFWTFLICIIIRSF